MTVAAARTTDRVTPLGVTDLPAVRQPVAVAGDVATRLREVVTISGSILAARREIVTKRSLTRHRFASIVFGEGGGATPRPLGGGPGSAVASRSADPGDRA